MTEYSLCPITTFNKHFVIDKILLNQTVFTIFKSLYHPNSNFLMNLLKSRDDTDINFSQIELNQPNDNSKFPIYTRYICTYIHPVGLKIPLAPKTVNIEDEYLICFESKETFKVQVTNKLSGFMMMDSFISRTLYIYETEGCNVKLNVKYGLEFIQKVLLQKVIEVNAYKENEKTIKEVIIQAIEKQLDIKEDKVKDVNEVVKLIEKPKKKKKVKKGQEKNIFQNSDLEYWYYSMVYY